MGSTLESDPLKEYEPKLDMASLIDISFLLLIFFMVSATLQKQEADLGLILPGISETDLVSIPADPATITVDAQGAVFLNDTLIDDNLRNRQLPTLIAELRKRRAYFQKMQQEPMVIIDCAGTVPQQRFIDVLNACAAVGIEQISMTQ